MRLNVELISKVYGELRDLAASEGRTVSEVTRELILNWINKKKREEARFLENGARGGLQDEQEG